MLHKKSSTTSSITEEDNDDRNSGVLTKEHQMLTTLEVKKRMVEALNEKQAKQALNALVFLIENGW